MFLKIQFKWTQFLIKRKERHIDDLDNLLKQADEQWIKHESSNLVSAEREAVGRELVRLKKGLHEGIETATVKLDELEDRLTILYLLITG